MRRPLLLALPLGLLAAPAVALTPEELWSAWQAQAAGFGLALSAEAVPGEGGALTLRNWTLAEGGGPAEPLPPDAPVRELRLTPAGEGDVAIELVGLPGTWTVPGGADALGDLYLAQRGLALRAREAGDAIEYEIAAASLQAASVPPADDPFAGNVAGEVQGLVLRVPSGIGADRRVEATLALTGFAYVANLGDPQIFTQSRQSSRNEGDLTLTLAATLPEGIDWQRMEGPDVVRALDAGLSVEIGAETGATRQSMRQDGFPLSYTTETTSEPGSGRLSLDRAGVTMEASAGGGSIRFTAADAGLPPVEASYGPVAGALRLPLSATPEDMGLSLSIEGLSFGDGLWSSLDPQGALPRDPIRLVVEGGGRIGLDLAAQAAAEAKGIAPPDPVLESLTLGTLQFAGAGVRLSASGRLDFPGGDPNAQPTGTATVRLEGADRLIDAMVDGGWITQDDAFNARMGLAAVLRPAGGADQREGTIEMKADGTVVANGVPLP